MIDKPIAILKDIKELPSRQFSIKMGRAAVTNRTATSEYTAHSSFSDNEKYLSAKPLRRPEIRRLQK